MQPDHPRHETLRFNDANALANELATHVALRLAAAIATRGQASLVVSGGRTPTRLFAALAAHPIAWSKIGVTLADERWVDADHPASNARFVETTLLRECAAEARFIGLKQPAATAEHGAAAAWQALDVLPRPFDIVILGMGDDGHVASLFPSSPGLAAALDPSAAPGCVAMRAPVDPRERVSMNLAALLDTRLLVLHIEGEAKWSVYETACAGDGVTALPVRALLRQSRAPLAVYWSP